MADLQEPAGNLELVYITYGWKMKVLTHPPPPKKKTFRKLIVIYEINS